MWTIDDNGGWVQPDWYYEISVGIVRFPEQKAERFQAYKALQAGYGIYLKDIVSSGGFDSPYYVDSFVLESNDLTKWKEINVESSMKNKFEWFDSGTMSHHVRMLKELESVGCKMIYINREMVGGESLIDRIPEEYSEDFICNIEWFKMLMN